MQRQRACQQLQQLRVSHTFHAAGTATQPNIRAISEWHWQTWMTPKLGLVAIYSTRFRFISLTYHIKGQCAIVRDRFGLRHFLRTFFTCVSQGGSYSTYVRRMRCEIYLTTWSLATYIRQAVYDSEVLPISLLRLWAYPSLNRGINQRCWRM